MNLTRRTYWANGLVTDREMSIEMSKSLDFVDEQSRRVKNGPGIKCVKIYDSRNRCYMVLTPEGNTHGD